VNQGKTKAYFVRGVDNLLTRLNFVHFDQKKLHSVSLIKCII